MALWIACRQSSSSFYLQATSATHNHQAALNTSSQHPTSSYGFQIESLLDQDMAKKILELIAHDMERAREAGREEVRRELGARGLALSTSSRKRPPPTNTEATEGVGRPAPTTDQDNHQPSFNQLREEFKEMVKRGELVDLREFHGLIKRIKFSTPNKDNSGDAKWKQRVAKWDPQFKQCIQQCHGGNEEAFYGQTDHKGKFPIKKTCCICRK